MKMMRGPDLERWQARNLRENSDYELRVGDRFMDQWLVWNTIMAIDDWGPEPLSVENHGSMTTKQDDGAIEHYALYGWQKKFRVERKEA